MNVDMVEWQHADAATRPELKGKYLPDEGELRARLGHHRDKVAVRELRNGLSISTTSYVGTVDLGSVVLRIRPKLDPHSFASLLKYSVGLPLPQFESHDVALDRYSFVDLLVNELASEALRLVTRGLYRHYLRREASLSVPKGRIVFDRLARQLPTEMVSVPCRFHVRDDNFLPNQVLLAGLKLGQQLAVDARVRSRAGTPAALLAESVQPAPLNANIFQKLRQTDSRLTIGYNPALRLIQLLAAGYGISFTAGREQSPLPGFLFNMNQLFQDVLGRFLRESLLDVDVAEQHELNDLYRYLPGFAGTKTPPRPRPDYVISRGRKVVAIADAKYRDLWQHDLPVGMLYQLSVYAR